MFLQRRSRCCHPAAYLYTGESIDSNSIIRNSLQDITNPFNPGNRTGVAHIDFPESLRNSNLDEAQVFHQLRSFLQEPGTENRKNPIFPKGEYVLLMSNYFSRGSQESFEPVRDFHTDAPGGPGFLSTFFVTAHPDAEEREIASSEEFRNIILDNLKDSLHFEDNLEKASVVATACEKILSSPNPRKRFHEAGILTFNAWWITKGIRKLSFINQLAFSNLTHGKSIWDFYGPGNSLPGTWDPIWGPDLKEEAAARLAEDFPATEGMGFLFNSALVLHRGYDSNGSSREVRIAAIPVTFLNKVAGTTLDWADVHLMCHERKAEKEAHGMEVDHMGVDDMVTEGMVWYVAEEGLETIKDLLDAKEVLREEHITALTIPEDLEDDAIMLPVDMQGIGLELHDLDQIFETLGPQGAAEAFIEARAHFVANEAREPEELRPQPQTVAEWWSLVR